MTPRRRCWEWERVRIKAQFSQQRFYWLDEKHASAPLRSTVIFNFFFVIRYVCSRRGAAGVYPQAFGEWRPHVPELTPPKSRCATTSLGSRLVCDRYGQVRPWSLVPRGLTRKIHGGSIGVGLWGIVARVFTRRVSCGIGLQGLERSSFHQGSKELVLRAVW